MKWLYLKNLDTLFFRDGKPFWMGDETKANLMFPPSPRTFYGALRTYIIMKYSNLVDYKKYKNIMDVVGDETKFGNLRISGPFIYDSYNDTIFFPKPKDIMKDENNIVHILKPKSLNNYYTNLDYHIDLVIPENYETLIKIEEIENKLFIEDYYLNYYLSYDLRNLSDFISDKTDLYKLEYKIGIKLDKNSGSIVEGMLYSLNHIRFNKNIGFILGLESDNNYLEKEGIFRLGGETRVVYFEDISNEINEKLKVIKKSSFNSINDKKFKTILLTPAIFKNGWFPDFLENNNGELIGNFLNTNIKVKLVGCILGKPKSIGGFDLVKKSPKSIFKSVPEGSVYYFEVLSDNANWKDLILEYNFNSILTYENLKKEGFGQILIGGW